MSKKKKIETQDLIKKASRKRPTRFRILVCIDGSENSINGIREAAKIAKYGDCDIILLFVRAIDQGLRTGGLQVRVARQNMLDWGIELPGIQHLKYGLRILQENGIKIPKNSSNASHTDVWGDPLGDNKIEYKNKNGQTIVLKLKTAPDIATGILDQCELGPYNLIIVGPSKTWQGKWRAFWTGGISQRIAMLAPSSVLMARNKNSNLPSHLIYTNGSAASIKYVCQCAVLANHCKYSISLLSIVKSPKKIKEMEKKVTQISNKLNKLEIEVKSVIIDAGDPMTTIIRESKNFGIISIPCPKSYQSTIAFSQDLSLKVMGAATVSTICVR